MPARVLELSDADTAEAAPIFRLVDDSNCALGSSYMTLSYCWGAPPAVDTGTRRVTYCLESATETDLRKTQSSAVLPKPLQQAIEAARRLGSRYLWIDRLYILQDSDEDWRREAARMADVYKNACLSTAALGARNSEDGLFWDREPSQILPTIVNIRMEGDSSEARPFIVESVLQRHRVFGNLHFDEKKTPLLSRAWVMQERLLAPRVVYFGRRQVFGECNTSQCCEVLPADAEVIALRDAFNVTAVDMERHQPDDDVQSYNWNKAIGFDMDEPKADDAYERLFLSWNRMVEMYTLCGLKNASDKLIAISGLAHDMGAKMAALRPDPHRYLAGLWEEQLPESLVWLVNGYHPRTPKSHRYRAPS